MPIISTTPHNNLSYVYVRINWWDYPLLTCAKVTRHHVATGTSAPLRAYVAPCVDEGCIQLSGGEAVFWDTKAPLDQQFFYTTEACDPTVTATVESPLITMPSGDGFWLKDPVRPCHDQRILVARDLNPNCPPGRGIFFLSMATESYQNNSQYLLPANAKLSIGINRRRRGVTSTLALATRAFADRDALLAELDPGSPLLFQGPQSYGIPDVYMGIGEVSVDRGLQDHRFQPRLFTIPFTAVQRPAGTTQGICGTRFDDMCDVYSNWDAMETAGLEYVDLINGNASSVSPTLQRTWLEIETTYPNWLAVETGNADWAAVRDG